ncbi:MAG: 4,5-DOPA dioxygenase extradiol [Sphingobacteriaceae bacterium]|nr:4,5-DOPA dioxygenase extradiol [Sphingobacteriaceae bacterium]
MDRKQFIKLFSLIPLAGMNMKLSDLNKFSQQLPLTEKMPVLFLGHGSPMNAIEENEYVSGFRTIAKTLPKVKAIVCVSAHWYTKGTMVTAMPKPKTIHDFGGFPEALYKVQYSAPGAPELAKQTKELIKKASVGLDETWGLDHGAWSVLKHLFPNADVPVIQLSIDYTKDAQWHFELAKELQSLRDKGILIVGSGNIIHNLYDAAFDRINENFGYDWAIEAREKTNALLLKGDFDQLIHYEKFGKPLQKAVPTPDHYLPLIYTLGLKNEKDKLELFNDKLLAGSLSMTSVKIG